MLLMALHHHIKYICALLCSIALSAIVYSQTIKNTPHQLHILLVDKDNHFASQTAQLQTLFKNAKQCLDYVYTLPALLQAKGFTATSVDSIRQHDSSTTAYIYLGTQQKWIQLVFDSIDKKALDDIGINEKQLLKKPVNFYQIQSIKESLLNYYEKNGYPFAAVYLDSIKILLDNVQAILKLSRGPLYHIDSIKVIGKAKIANSFLQKYLSIPNGSVYNKAKLETVSKKILELPYLQEQQASEVQLLGTGAVLNVYLQPKKSSQVNFLIGFLPANTITNKLQLTGDINLNLKNTFGNGETILLNWQQLQLKSPRLHIGYQQPYIFRSPFGFNFNFDLFKKDSTFLQLNAILGLQYLLSANQSGKLFLQQQSTTLLGEGVDTNLIKATKKLPANIDMSALSVGVDYELRNTDYLYNPVKGNEIKLIASVGFKTIKKSNEVLSLTNANFNYASLYDSVKTKSYQFKIKLMAAHYFSTGKKATLKTMVNIGVYNSESVFKNELFQIGGYKLLRGFDEESIFATQYAVATAEYRYLLGLNSYMFGFTDVGFTKNKYQTVNQNNNFISAGIGLAYETKVGLLNISLAFGIQNNVQVNVRSASKIHFGYVNYF
jgi:outer membrane protein assembly factor BamA